MPRPNSSWLLLLYSLPSKCNTERVGIWRRLKKIGAVQLTTSTYLLPEQPAQYEHFQWLAKEIRDSGGESTLVRAQEIEGLTREKIVSLFNSARDQDYRPLKKSLQAILTKRKKSEREASAADLERLTRQFRELRQIDFFDSPGGHDVAMLLRRTDEVAKHSPPQLDQKNYQRRTWQTRPRPEIDRVGSAWLIRKFIDPKAKFVFASESPSQPDILRFDMLDAEFSHHGDRCTFETLIWRFAINDKAMRKLGEMIHDADLDDAKFQRVECIGLDRVFKGWGKAGMQDDEILAAGFKCFDGLYEFLQRR